MPNDNAVALPTTYHSPEAQVFDLLQRQGKMLAASAIVPEVYRGQIADCALIYEIASRVKASPVLVANNLDLIHGRPSWRAQFLIACVNQSGRFSALRYEYEGEGKTRKCRAWARELASGDRLDGTWITWQMAEAEGWTKKAGSKWLTMPEQMFAYRAAAFWTRVYAPEIALGFPTDDEVRDIIDVTPLRPDSDALASINAAVTHKAEAPPPQIATAKDSAPALSFALIADKLQKATDVDLLDAHASLIGDLPDEGQREELKAIYHARRETLTKD